MAEVVGGKWPAREPRLEQDAGWVRGVVDSWRERRVARRASIESLKLYRVLEAEHPELAPVDRYREFVARRTGLGPDGVSAVLRHAEDSFASWPVERPLRFRDVVQYLVVYDCLSAEPEAAGTRTRLTTVIAEVIPGDL